MGERTARHMVNWLLRKTDPGVKHAHDVTTVRRFVDNELVVVLGLFAVRRSPPLVAGLNYLQMYETKEHALGRMHLPGYVEIGNVPLPTIIGCISTAVFKINPG